MYKNQHSVEEEKILKLLNSGSEFAFQIVYDKYRSRVYEVAMRYLKSPVIAQEVVQEVFLKLWTKREQIDCTLPVEGWLYTVAKNNVLNKLNRLAKEWKALDYLKNNMEVDDSSIQDKINQEVYLNIFNKALNSLSEMQLRVYRMAKEENLSYLQIAESLEISPLTVKTHMSRALGNIRSFVTLNGNLLSTLIGCAVLAFLKL